MKKNSKERKDSKEQKRKKKRKATFLYSIIGVILLSLCIYLIVREKPIVPSSRLDLAGRGIKLEFTGKAPSKNSSHYENLMREINGRSQLAIGQLDQAIPIGKFVFEKVKRLNVDEELSLKGAMVILDEMGYKTCKHISPPLCWVAKFLSPKKEACLVKGKVRGPDLPSEGEGHTWVEVEGKVLDWYQFTPEKDKYIYRWYQKFFIESSERDDFGMTIKVNAEELTKH